MKYDVRVTQGEEANRCITSKEGILENGNWVQAATAWRRAPIRPARIRLLKSAKESSSSTDKRLRVELVLAEATGTERKPLATTSHSVPR